MTEALAGSETSSARHGGSPVPGASLDRLPNHCELAILRHPDQETTWTVVGVAHVEPAATSDPAGALLDRLHRRIPILIEGLPMAAARLDGERWRLGAGPVPVIASHSDPTPPSMLTRFDLTSEPPLRLLVDPEGRWVSFFVHHAALDGARLLVTIKTLLCEAPVPAPEPELPTRGEIPWSVLARLLRPADPVAPSAEPPRVDSFVARPLPLLGAGVSSRLPEALLEAVKSFSAARGCPLRRVGITLGISRTQGPANRNTYRRVDRRVGQPIGPAIEAALRVPEDPWEIRHSTRLLRLFTPLAPRLSDTVILTNLGRQSMPGITRLEGYPVARGRSAVAFGAVRLAGGESTLCLRARDINVDDADGIIDEVIERLEKES